MYRLEALRHPAAWLLLGVQIIAALLAFAHIGIQFAAATQQCQTCGLAVCVAVFCSLKLLHCLHPDPLAGRVPATSICKRFFSAGTRLLGGPPPSSLIISNLG